MESLLGEVTYTLAIVGSSQKKEARNDPDGAHLSLTARPAGWTHKVGLRSDHARHTSVRWWEPEHPTTSVKASSQVDALPNKMEKRKGTELVVKVENVAKIR